MEKERHESYGIVSISRGSSSQAQPLFGSPIKHTNIITIEVRRANKETRFGTDYVYEDGRLPLISIDLSPAQFADLITTPNTSGTACTLRYVEGRNMERTPEPESIQIKAETNMADVHTDIIARLRALEQKISDSNIGKRLKEELCGDADVIKRHLESNVPFAVDCFNREVGKVMTAAKAEIEAAVQHKITVLGNQALVQQINEGRTVIEHKPLIEIE